MNLKKSIVVVVAAVLAILLAPSIVRAIKPFLTAAVEFQPVDGSSGISDMGSGIYVDNATKQIHMLTGNTDKTVPTLPATTKGDLPVYTGTAWSKIAAGSNGQCLTAQSAQSTGLLWAACSGGSGYSTIADEGSDLTQRTKLNFVGSMIACVDNSGASRTDCTLTAPTVYNQTIADEGTPLTQRATLDFAGSMISCADSGGTKTLCTLTAPTVYNQTIEDEATPLTQRSTVNFTGAGVSCADSGGKTVCTIGGGGSTGNFTFSANDMSIANAATFTSTVASGNAAFAVNHTSGSNDPIMEWQQGGTRQVYVSAYGANARIIAGSGKTALQLDGPTGNGEVYVSDALISIATGATSLNVSSGLVAPDGDSTRSLGGPSKRWSYVAASDAVGDLPTCDATTRGAITVVQSGAGVGDILKVCMKGTGDTYAYRDAFTAP